MSTVAVEVNRELPLPALSELTSDGAYRWIITPEERAHIARLLDCDASTISRQATLMAQDRQVCEGCGKYSGLDDLIQNALSLGVHSAEFMLDVLTNGPRNNSPGHELLCSSCGVKHSETFYWIPSQPW
ncbi:hypothetical protein BDW72DRAFT_207882 [Aspergillus terricola var. indicus]